MGDEIEAGTEMVKRSRRGDLHNTKTQMTASTKTAANNKGIKTMVGTVLASAVLPLTLVLGATMINAPNAEAYGSSTCRTTCYGNSCTTRCW